MSRSGESSGIEWISDDPNEVPPVPIEISPSGPAMLAIASRQANRIALGVGAAPDYVADYVRRARAAVEVAGRDPESVAFGGYVPLVVNDDPVVARREVRQTASAFAHFSMMKGQGRIGVDDRRPEALFREAKAVGSKLSYEGDPYRESTADGALGSMSDAFIDWSTAAGTPDQVIVRLRELAEAGVSSLHVLSGHHASPPPSGIATSSSSGPLFGPRDSLNYPSTNTRNGVTDGNAEDHQLRHRERVALLREHKCQGARSFRRSCHRDRSPKYVYCSGRTATDGDTDQVVGHVDIAAQTRQVLLNLGAALREAGATYDDIVRVFLALPFSVEDFAKIHEVRVEFFKKEHYPASTPVIVHQLARQHAMLEIDCDAVVIKNKG